VLTARKKNLPLQIDHISPKSRGGSNRVSNLTLACQSCNLAKGNLLLEEFVKDAAKVKRILSHTKRSLKDAAVLNATRYALE
jgi:5-methylcytosine-specific restriction endonuclease McrA